MHSPTLAHAAPAAPSLYPLDRTACSPCARHRIPTATQACKPVVAAHASLASKTNGIAAAPRPSLAAARAQQPPAPARLEVLAADGRRGGKLKTRKAAAKRYKVTGTGKVMVRHAGRNHFQEKKGAKRRNQLSNKKAAPESHADRIKRCLPNSGVQ
jgi:large subunit ribosomal protein L35